MDFIFTELPFYVKGHVLSYIGDYIFRKGRINEIFISRISRERIAEINELFAKIPTVMTWKKGIIWRSYIEFSDVSPIWRIIRQNYEYRRDEEDEKMITPEIFCYYERNYIHSNTIYQTPIV
jgi:hypothetical protein